MRINQLKLEIYKSFRTEILKIYFNPSSRTHSFLDEHFRKFHKITILLKLL
jgi:hypothetical protein